MELVKYNHENDRLIAIDFLKSGLFSDLKSPEQAIVKIYAGRELGLQPFQSIQGVDIIQGKPFIKPAIMGALIKQSEKYDYKVLEKTDEVCKIEFFEIFNGEKTSLGIAIYSIDDAKKMNLAGKDNYKKQPRVMLFNRCLSEGVRTFTPDVFMIPVYTESEEPNETVETAFEIIDEKNYISKHEFNQMVDLAKSRGILPDDLKAVWLKYGFEKGSTITKDKYQDIIKDLESK